MNTQTSEPVAESDAIRAEIEQTRESMDQTLDQIGERMKPKHLLDEVLDFFRSNPQEGETMGKRAGAVMHSAGDTAGRVASGMVNVVRRHPIPTLLIGAGLAWAWFERNRERGNGHELYPGEPEEHTGWSEGEGTPIGVGTSAQESASSTGEKIKSTATSAGQTLKEKGQQLTQRASEGMRAVGSKATQGARRAYQTGRDKFVQASDAHPLAMGVGFLAIGVIAGLALPHTAKEDELVGQVSDRAKGGVKAKAQGLVQSGKRVASAAAEAATQAAKDTAAQEGLTAAGGNEQHSTAA